MTVISIKELLLKLLSAPIIIESGASGDWIYRKWSDGTAECWGTHSWTITGWTAWSNTYYSNYCDAIAYPSNLFTAKPTVMANGHTSSGDAWLAGRGGTFGGSKDETPVFFLMRSSTGTNNITGYIDIHAIGKWK